MARAPYMNEEDHDKVVQHDTILVEHERRLQAINGNLAGINRDLSSLKGRITAFGIVAAIIAPGVVAAVVALITKT